MTTIDDTTAPSPQPAAERPETQPEVATPPAPPDGAPTGTGPDPPAAPADPLRTAEIVPGTPAERGRDKVIAKLRETVPLLAEAVRKRVAACPTGMKTRTALVEPVIQDVLAFDLRNPFEVDPDAQEIVDWLREEHPDVEWTAYALMQAAKAMMHIVAMPSTEKLPAQGVMTARIPCIPTRTPVAWTNGTRWAFVVRTTDDDEADAVVAHDFDFGNHTLVDIDELATFTRESLSDDEASDRIYGVYAERRAAEWLARELQEPSPAFIELAVAACHPGRRTQAVTAAYSEAVPKAMAPMAWTPPTRNTRSTPPMSAAASRAGSGSPSFPEEGLLRTTSLTPATLAGIAVIRTVEGYVADPPGA